MKSSCPICHSQDIRTLSKFRYKSPIFSICSLAQCQSCNMIFASPMPSEENLLAYNENYFSAAHGGQPTSKLATAFFSGVSRIRQTFLSAYLQRHGVIVKNVLEVGPGPGFFAKSWLEAEQHSSYQAIETDKSCHKHLSKLGIELVTYADVKPVELVVMSHVVEHVSDPLDFVRNACRTLKPGGALFIEVPCQDWVHKPVDEPHILFFDKAPMRRLLHDLGFEDIEISYYGKTISELKEKSILNEFISRVFRSIPRISVIR